MHYNAKIIAEFARRRKRNRVRNILLGGAGVGALAGGGLLLTRGKSGKVPAVANVSKSPDVKMTMTMTPKTPPVDPQVFAQQKQSIRDSSIRGEIAAQQGRKNRKNAVNSTLSTQTQIAEDAYLGAKRGLSQNIARRSLQTAKRAAGASGKRKFKITKRRTQPTKLRAIPKRLGGIPVGMKRKKVDLKQNNWKDVVLPNNKPWYYFVPDK